MSGLKSSPPITGANRRLSTDCPEQAKRIGKEILEAEGYEFFDDDEDE